MINSTKKLLLCGLLAMAMCCAQARTVYYGYTPHEPAEEEISVIGSGTNNFAELAIRLMPSSDPVVKQLQGARVLGVRVWLRTEYKQRTKGWSAVTLRRGDLETTALEKTVNFKAGWNEVMFDEPAVIGEQDLYIGARVFELLGEPFPFGTWLKGSASGVFFMKTDYSGWYPIDATRGMLMLEAIIETDIDPFVNTAYVGFNQSPLTVAPSRPFDCQLFVHNFSSEPLTAFSFTSSDGQVTNSYDLTFTPAVEPYGSRALPFSLTAPSQEGTAVALTLTPTQVNGQPAAAVTPFASPLYVMKDAFVRIPLVEEFTSQMCINCPFMFYYLDKAIEEHEGPLLYVSHHAGFADDAFTQPVDRDLLYLFPSAEPTYNPAVMYDRRVPVGYVSPIFAAQVAETDPYTEMIDAVAAMPAMAEVIVDASTNEDGELCVKVTGAVNRNYYYEDIPVYLSCYLVESGISAAKYPQKGLDDEGAPADLKERFHHNGIIRHNFCRHSLGDELNLLDINDTFVYDEEYDPIALDPNWNWDNCDVIAFVHLIDQDDRTANYLLNAGSLKVNGTQTGLFSPTLDFAPARQPFPRYYDLNGRPATAETPGIVIRDGQKRLLPSR